MDTNSSWCCRPSLVAQAQSKVRYLEEIRGNYKYCCQLLSITNCATLSKLAKNQYIALQHSIDCPSALFFPSPICRLNTTSIRSNLRWSVRSSNSHLSHEIVNSFSADPLPTGTPPSSRPLGQLALHPACIILLGYCLPAPPTCLRTNLIVSN